MIVLQLMIIPSILGGFTSINTNFFLEIILLYFGDLYDFIYLFIFFFR